MQRQLLLSLLVTLGLWATVYASCDLISLSKCKCDHPKNKRYDIDCHSAGLTSLPGKVNYSLPAEVDVTGNFSYNAIKSIPDFYFLHMTHFEVIDFTSNSISELHKNSLKGLETKLTKLILSRNRIRSVEPTALQKYIRLNDLDLSRNRISSPCGIHTADVITYSLANNGITSLGAQCFPDSQKVEYLDLSGNKISSISGLAFQDMGILKSLNLADNVLSDLGGGLNSLTTIDSFESLSLRGNNLQFISSICPYILPNIKIIDFGYNKLKDIRKYCFSAYAKLNGGPPMTLNFEHNRISALAASTFAGLDDRVAVLLLNHNYIAKINVNTFRGLNKLTKLDLSDNQIDNLEFLRHWDDNSLQEFTVANNLLTDLSPKVFKKMIKLTKLSIDGNLLLSIEANAFEGMFLLTDFSARYNLLTNIEGGAFNGLGELKKLAISGNALVTLKNCTFASLDRLIQFHFEDNLLHCDCDLLWLLDFMPMINTRGVPDDAISAPILYDYCQTPKVEANEFVDNAVSLRCPKELTDSCFGLKVSYDEPLDGQLNVTFTWTSGKSVLKSVVMSQLDTETDIVVFNTSNVRSLPVTFPLVEEDKIYKVSNNIK